MRREAMRASQGLLSGKKVEGIAFVGSGERGGRRLHHSCADHLVLMVRVSAEVGFDSLIKRELRQDKQVYVTP